MDFLIDSVIVVSQCFVVMVDSTCFCDLFWKPFFCFESVVLFLQKFYILPVGDWREGEHVLAAWGGFDVDNHHHQTGIPGTGLQGGLTHRSCLPSISKGYRRLSATTPQPSCLTVRDRNDIEFIAGV